MICSDCGQGMIFFNDGETVSEMGMDGPSRAVGDKWVCPKCDKWIDADEIEESI